MNCALNCALLADQFFQHFGLGTVVIEQRERAESAGSDDFEQRMEDLGNRLVAAKDDYLKQKGVDDRLFADRFAPDR